VFVASTAATSFYFLKHDPKLVERRMAAGPMAESESTQKVIMAVTSVCFILLAVGPGLDHLWYWSDVPAWLVLLANAGVACSFAAIFFVLKQNSFAAATIRVEAEQPVISTGAYGIVRHPMYAGALPMIVFTPLALGSYWTALVLIPMVPALVWRLLDEERFLTLNLAAYADYCRQVRYRLIPGIW
jgi:protein-S-isoprenylcysteine O-methyltransferase Ste14